MNRGINPFGLRMPEHLKKWLKAQTKKHNRSLNAEINTILDKEARYKGKILKQWKQYRGYIWDYHE